MKKLLLFCAISCLPIALESMESPTMTEEIQKFDPFHRRRAIQSDGTVNLNSKGEPCGTQDPLQSALTMTEEVELGVRIDLGEYTASIDETVGLCGCKGPVEIVLSDPVPNHQKQD